MARKDHLPTPQEEAKIAKRNNKRNNAIVYQAIQPTIANQINGIGATSKTPDEVKDTKWPLLPDINEIGKNLSGAFDIDLSLESSPFSCWELSDVGNTISAVTVNLLNLVKNKAETFFLDITKDPGNTVTPTVTFDPPIQNLPPGFPTDNPRYLLEVIARETPNETRYEVVNRGGGGGIGGSYISAALGADQTTNIAVGDHIEFDTDTTPKGADGGIVLQTGAGQLDGIFELEADKTYYLTASVKSLFSATNHIEFVWYNITDAAEMGVRAVQDDATLAIDQAKSEITFKPVTNITCELRIVVVTTGANLTGFDADFTFASIFEFGKGADGADGQQGADGTDGTDGTNGAAGAAGGTGTNISAVLSADQTTNKLVNDHIEFDTLDHDGGIVLETGAGQLDGIFQLKQDITYYLSGNANAQFSAVNSVELVWYDRTNAAEIGKRSLQDNNSNTVPHPSCQTIFTPSTDVDVELRIVAVQTPGNLSGFDADFSFGNIFEFVDTQAGSVNGGSMHPFCKVIPRLNVNVNSMPITQDLVTTATGDRILLVNQTTKSQNGIWEVISGVGLKVLGRPADFAAGSVQGGMAMVSVYDGKGYAGTTYVMRTGSVTVDTTDQTWEDILVSKSTIQGRQTPDFNADASSIDLRRENVDREFWGNYAHITNTAGTVSGIQNFEWRPGSVVYITAVVSNTMTLTHDEPTVGEGSTAPGITGFWLAGAVDASFNKDTTFCFILDTFTAPETKSYWREVSRTVG